MSLYSTPSGAQVDYLIYLFMASHWFPAPQSESRRQIENRYFSPRTMHLFGARVCATHKKHYKVSGTSHRPAFLLLLLYLLVARSQDKRLRCVLLSLLEELRWRRQLCIQAVDLHWTLYTESSSNANKSHSWLTVAGWHILKYLPYQLYKSTCGCDNRRHEFCMTYYVWFDQR